MEFLKKMMVSIFGGEGTDLLNSPSNSPSTHTKSSTGLDFT